MVVLGFVGDVLVNRSDGSDPFRGVQPALDGVDILFGNCEGVYTDAPEPGSKLACLAGVSNTDELHRAGFDVMSFANNHTGDAGEAGVRDTIDALAAAGIAVIGAGADINAAHRPHVAEAKGIRIGYLAYASYFPLGYEATDNRAGLAQIRSQNKYVDRYPGYSAPGFRPEVRCEPAAGDLERLADDIKALRDAVDVVVTSFHWGDHDVPYHVTDHERTIARFAIGQGADAVIGHHHHLLRGMEWFNARPIFYGLNHFVFDFPMPAQVPPQLQLPGGGALTADDRSFYGLSERAGWPLHPWHPDARSTVLAWVALEGRSVAGAGFLPCHLRPDGSVEGLPASASTDAHPDAVTSYLRDCCRTQGFDVTLAPSELTLGGLRTVAVRPGRS